MYTVLEKNILRLSGLEPLSVALFVFSRIVITLARFIK